MTYQSNSHKKSTERDFTDWVYPLAISHLEDGYASLGLHSSNSQSGIGRLRQYLRMRQQSRAQIKQDLLPLLVYTAVGGRPYTKAIPLTAVWMLYLFAAHVMDEAQDRREVALANEAAMALGVASTQLSQLEVEQDRLTDFLDALGRVTALGGMAQGEELVIGRSWKREGYFRNIMAKSATIMATGCWVGGRLHSDDVTLLTQLKEFGLTLGMFLQLSDDCADLEGDLLNGTYTLPVLEGLTMTTHPAHKRLKALTDLPQLTQEQAQCVIGYLQEMGVLTICQRMIRSYQLQIGAVFETLPALAPYFQEYVVPKS